MKKMVFMLLCVCIFLIFTACGDRVYEDTSKGASQDITPTEKIVVLEEYLSPTFISTDAHGDAYIASTYFPNDYKGYRYPILPQMSTWPYGNHADMVMACQIPDDILRKMTTEELLETVLQYPLASDVYAWNSIREGLEVVMSHFNGMQELAKRKDKSSVMYRFLREHPGYSSKMCTDFFFMDEFGLTDIMTEEEINYLIFGSYCYFVNE